ncbi:hypothetical protein [Flavobacterium sp. H122]|uniref:hypothetical protein n=1 Tax=Flavobacterium sp. H122 TaxID=2529860 RepID=UPI0010AAF073|nr:hypothetical protein [Flavobacterium sp. H122]
MKKQPTRKGRALLFIGMASLILGLTVFRENNTPKMILLITSIITLLASIYLNAKTAMVAVKKQKEKE